MNRIAQSRKQNKSYSPSLKTLFQSLDFYGKPVLLTFKGQSKIKTTLGAIISFIVFLLWFHIFGRNLYRLFRWNRNLYHTNSPGVYLASEEFHIENLTDKNFILAFSLVDSSSKLSSLNKSHGSLTLIQRTQRYSLTQQN